VTFGVSTHKPYATIGPITRERALSLVKADWFYDWSLTPAVYPGIEAVPMVWDEKSVGKAIGGNSQWLLTFNEADSPYQANMSLRTSVVSYRALEVANPNRKLVSPAPTADDWVWRDQWLNEYIRLYGRKPRVDAVATHIYPRTWQYFLDAMDAAWSFAQVFGVKVWITEYAYLPGWPGGIGAAAEMVGRITQHCLDNPDKFERWAPFILSHTGAEGWAWGTEHNVSLVSKTTGKLTHIGSTYADLHPSVDYADPRADVNKDGTVDILDIVLVGSSFGKPVE